MELLPVIGLFLGGIITGTLGALLGLGGGIFLVPFLVLVYHLPTHQAIATSLVSVIATSSMGAALNLRRGVVHVRFAMVLEVATVLGAIGGGMTAAVLSGDTLTRIFGILAATVAVLMLIRLRMGTGHTSPGTALQTSFYDHAEQKEITYGVKRIPATMAVSFFAGNISGLLGVGGGVFKVPAMLLLSGVPMKAATGTSNFMIGVTAAASAFIYMAQGHLDPFITAATVPGVLLGSMMGIELNKRLTSNVIIYIFVGVLLYTAVRMFFR